MAGIDPLNQFPNSNMAGAVKRGQSRMFSGDAPSIEVGEQNNVNIAAATALTVPATATYCTVQAIGGAAQYTFDGTVPGAGNGQQLTQGAVLPIYGPAMASLKIIGVSMSVVYFK
jgi:hypothetical protein